MAALFPSVFAKHSGNSFSTILFCAVLFESISIFAANDICTQYKQLILKPISIYKYCNIKIDTNYTKSAPTVAFPPAMNMTSFNLTTIVMLSPKGHNSVHWLRIDIPKDLLAVGTSKGDDDIYDYKGPNPPEDTGVYDYQFYLLSQPMDSNISIAPYIGQYRKDFKLAEFKNGNNMQILGAFQIKSEYGYNGSGRPSFTVALGVISVALTAFFNL